MLGKYKLAGLGVFAGLLMGCLFVFGGHSWAISGAATYFPDTSPFGQAPSYTVVQVTGKKEPSANVYMKARTTVANIYVNKNLANTSVTLRIAEGCDNGPRDHDSYMGDTTFDIYNGASKATTSKSSKDPANLCGFLGITDIYVAFNVVPTNPADPYASVYHNGQSYYVYQFISSANASEAGTGRYLNAFGLSTYTPGDIQVGISNKAVPCANAIYPISCPSSRPWRGIPGSWSYSSFYGPTGISTYTQQINIRNSCDVSNALISLYDLDAEDSGMAQNGLSIQLLRNGVPMSIIAGNGTPLDKLNAYGYNNPFNAFTKWETGIFGLLNAHPGYSGKNNAYMDLPPAGDPMFGSFNQLDKDTDYTLIIAGINSANAIQVLPSITNCPTPVVDTNPSVTIAQDCNAPYTALITVNDGDYATNGGAPLINYSVNGGAPVTVRARSYAVTMPDPTAGFSISANSTGVLPAPPGGDGAAGASRSASNNFGPCTYTFALTSQPQPPALDDPELPTQATSTPLIGFSGGATVVNSVSTTRDYFRNRGGTYNAGTGTVVGGVNTPLLASAGLGINVSGKPSDGTLGTTTIPGISGVIAADRICVRLTLSPATGSVNAAGVVQPGSGGSSVRVQCTTVVNRPYLKVYGSDIMAGSGFGANCSAKGSDVFAYAKRLAAAPNNWVGAGTQLGVFANGVVNMFASSSVISPSVPSAKVFANNLTTGTAVVSGSVFGGGYDSTFCDDDFWASKATSVSAVAGAVPALNTLASGQYQYNSGTTIASAPADITNRVAIYVDGDITISTNIRMATTAPASVSSLPSFYLIVRGNIYITPGVTQLDGVYVAMPRSPATNLNTPADGGRIFTCTDAGPAPSNAALSGACITNKLTVNGSFSATRINFLRGGGSLRGATAGELGGSANIAEVFNFLPESLLGIPAPAVTTLGQYDSVISLPPGL